MIQLESEHLTVSIDPFGAQLNSIYGKQDGLEYLWQKDPDVWNSSAPVVFPIIGKLNNMEYRLNGKHYSMRSNGLIRYEQLQVLSADREKAVLQFTSTKQTYEQYPFHCHVILTFTLSGRCLQVHTDIYNDDDKLMYFNYGGHPGFRIPLQEKESSNDYYVEFEENENAWIYEVCESGQLTEVQRQFFMDERRFFIRRELFLKEALAFQNVKSQAVSIRNLYNDKAVTLRFSGFDGLGIWSPCRKQPVRFICLEPWLGHADFVGFHGELSQRHGMQSLRAGEAYSCDYEIEISQGISGV